MKKMEISEMYKGSMPITKSEIRKLLLNQPLLTDIIKDSLTFADLEYKAMNFDYIIALNNALSIGLMLGKREERAKRKQIQTAKFSNNIGKSMRTWKKLNEDELLNVIQELRLMDENHFCYSVKKELLEYAKKIYAKNFIQ